VERLDERPGTIVLDTRLAVLLPTVDGDLVWTEVDRAFEVVAATSTVRCTGRDRVILLRDELPAVDLDGAATLEGIDRFG